MRLDEGLGEASDTTIAVPVAQGKESAHLTVTVSAPGFDVLGPRTQSMVIKRKHDPRAEQTEFHLLARNPGIKPLKKEIRADFWLDNSCIGSATFVTVVKPKSYSGASLPKSPSSSEPVTISSLGRQDCDLVIGVTRDVHEKGENYEIVLHSRVPGHSYDFKAAGTFELEGTDLAAYLKEMIDPKFQTYPADDPKLSDEEFAAALKAWGAQFVDWLRDIGRQLWEFLPKEFREEYLKLQNASYPPSSVLVHSDEMVFPWELVVPWSVENGHTELPSLGVAHILGRWQPGLGLRPDPQKLQVQKFLIINPTYDQNELEWTAAEIRALQQLFPNSEVLVPADLQALQRVLDRSDLQIVHFSGHGTYDTTTNADLSALLLEKNTVLPAITIVGKKLGAAHPILYLNACSVGRVGMVVGRMGGFAANCLKSGWSGVIAPYWPINDESARDFSASLYKKLKLGRSIGEAIQELRVEHPNDPTFQAYSYIGDPWTRALFAQ